MSILNTLLQGLFDALLYPFRGFHPLVGLTVISLVTGIGFLYVFKWTSDQDKMEVVKRRIHAGLFEIRLFNDDLRAILRSQGDILRHNTSYIRLSLVPLLWMIVPLVLMAGQLMFNYAYQGLVPGDQTLVQVALDDDWQGDRPPAELVVPAGLRIDAGPVWIPALRELTWRVAIEKQGSYELALQWDEETYTKALEVTGDVVRRSPVRPDTGIFAQLLYPAEAPLPPEAPIKRISISYPEADLGLLTEGNELLWMLVYIVVTVVFAFALRKPLGVTI